MSSSNHIIPHKPTWIEIQALACKIGLEEAVLCEKLIGLLANPKYCTVDEIGANWIKISNKSLIAEFVPFWTDKQLRRVMKSIFDKNLIYIRRQLSETSEYQLTKHLFSFAHLGNTPPLAHLGTHDTCSALPIWAPHLDRDSANVSTQIDINNNNSSRVVDNINTREFFSLKNNNNSSSISNVRDTTNTSVILASPRVQDSISMDNPISELPKTKQWDKKRIALYRALEAFKQACEPRIGFRCMVADSTMPEPFKFRLDPQTESRWREIAITYIKRHKIDEIEFTNRLEILGKYIRVKKPFPTDKSILSFIAFVKGDRFFEYMDSALTDHDHEQHKKQASKPDMVYFNRPIEKLSGPEIISMDFIKSVEEEYEKTHKRKAPWKSG